MFRGFVLVLSFSLALCHPVYGSHIPPDQLVREVAGDIIAATRDDPRLRSDKARLRALVEERVVPHLDFEAMGRLALGRHARNATREEMARFTSEFRTLLIRMYSASLAGANGVAVSIETTRYSSDKKSATVRMLITRSGEEALAIDFAMEEKNDQWLVYDITFGGVSLITTFRDQFGDEIRRSGMEGLIAKLRSMNSGKK